MRYSPSSSSHSCVEDTEELLEVLAVDDCRERGVPSSTSPGVRTEDIATCTGVRGAEPGVKHGGGVEAEETFCRAFESSTVKFPVPVVSTRSCCSKDWARAWRI